jgi:hypothetical protein
MTKDSDLLRHAVATLAYRAAKILRDAPAGFASVPPAANSHGASLRVSRGTTLLPGSLPRWKLLTPGSGLANQYNNRLSYCFRDRWLTR